MSRTITAMFDSRSEAESARDRLSQSNIEAERVRIIDQGDASASPSGESPGEEGFFAALKDMFMPDEDRQAYGEGIRRGGFMLCADVDEHQADQACDILDQSSSVDFEQRQSEWRSDGWTGFQADRQSGAFGQLSGGEPERTGIQSHSDDAAHGQGMFGDNPPRTGRREMERGNDRVRTYVRDDSVSMRDNFDRGTSRGRDEGLL